MKGATKCGIVQEIAGNGFESPIHQRTHCCGMMRINDNALLIHHQHVLASRLGRGEIADRGAAARELDAFADIERRPDMRALGEHCGLFLAAPLFGLGGLALPLHPLAVGNNRLAIGAPFGHFGVIMRGLGAEFV